MKKFLVVLAAAFMAVGAEAAAAAGSCEQKATALSVGATKTGRLVEEWDAEMGEGTGNAVYYFAATLTRGKSYTLWLSGANATDLMVNGIARSATEAEYDREIYEPVAGFNDSEVYESQGIQVTWLYAEDWDYEDPASWRYYIVVEGDAVGTQFTVNLVEGTRQFVPYGLQENPEPLTLSTKAGSVTRTLTEEGSYFFLTKLTTGRLYKFRSVGAPVRFTVTRDGEALQDDEWTEDPQYESDPNTSSYFLKPQVSGSYMVEVEADKPQFTLSVQQLPSRAISAHASEPIADGDRVEFELGPLCTGTDYYDEIVDSGLFKFTMAKGDRYVFATEGASTTCRMYLYNSSGAVLATNDTIGNEALDVQIGYEATAAGTFYVGVCETGLAFGQEGSETSIALVCSKITGEKGTETAISPNPASEYDVLEKVGAVVTSEGLDETVWTRTFAIGGRKGVTYRLSSDVGTENVTDLTLKTEVFTRSGTSEAKVAFTGGVDYNAEAPLEFTAKTSATHYVRVSVAEGKSLPYPEFNLYAMAYQTGVNLGTLCVHTKGAPAATWSIGSETTKYGDMISILVPAGSQTVKFAKVTGFSQPAQQTVNVVTGVVTEVTGVYSDTFDPKDDSPKTPTALKLSNKVTRAPRTLWAEDPVDYFSFAAKSGIYYDFALADLVGAATISISNAATGKVVFENGTEVKRLALDAGNYILAVQHADKADASYTLEGLQANVGSVKLASTAVKAKESAESVTLNISRTGREGKVRVRYRTVADTAKPGEDYYPQSGVLEWDNGVNAAKKLVIKLIPDLRPVYEGDKTFRVQLEPMPESELAEGEYPATFAPADVATVTLTEATKPVPGTIRWSACGDTAGRTLSEKKPVVVFPAEVTSATFWLERALGSDGEVSVTVQTVKGSGVAGKDFVEKKETLTWGPGETAPKPFAVEMPSVPTADKTFTVKITALTVDKIKPKVGAALSVTRKATPVSKAAVLVADLGDGEGTSGKVSADLAVGTFAGLLRDEDEAVTNATARLGTLSVTVASSGSISAKAVVAGKTYSFSAKQFDEILDQGTIASDESSKTLGVTLRGVQKIAGVTYTNTLELAIVDGSSLNTESVGASGGTAVLTLTVPDANGKGAQEEILYTSTLARDNAKVVAYAGALRDYAGYYTVALVPGYTMFGLPQGTGYLTMKLDPASGKATIAGKLADGAAVTYNAFGIVQGDLADMGACALKVPVFFSNKKSNVFGGEMMLAVEESADGSFVPVVREDDMLIWRDDAVTSTYDGEPLAMDLVPAGGWYDTVLNLQRRYLESALYVQPLVSEDLPEELLPAGYTYSVDAFAVDLPVNLVGNKVTVDKYKLVKDAATKQNDFAASVNPCNVQINYARATGLVTGGLSLWVDDGKTQRQISGAKHYGVMLLSRAKGSLLDDDIVTAGFLLLPKVVLPVKRKWVSSLPFNVRAMDAGVDWSEE